MAEAKYVIVGGGLAGGSAVRAIRQADPEGRLILITDEPYPPYDRVPLSKTYLLGKFKRERLFLLRPEQLDPGRTEVRTGSRAVALDPAGRTLALDSGETVRFERLLLATGGRPRRLPLPGSDLAGVHYLRTIDDSDRIRSEAGPGRRAVVIGGSFIGCEVAVALHQLGVRVTIFEIEPLLFGRVFDPAVAGALTRFIRGKGIRVETGASIVRFLGRNGRVAGVELADGRTFEADFAVVGVGIALNTELAEGAGLEVQNGVVVDERLQTPVEGIFAAGDIARYYSPLYGRHLRVEHYDTAVKHGRRAGLNLTGRAEPYDGLPYFFSYLLEVNLHVVGDFSRWDAVLETGPPSFPEPYVRYYFEGDRLAAVLMVNTPPPSLPAAEAYVRQRPSPEGLRGLARPELPVPPGDLKPR